MKSSITPRTSANHSGSQQQRSGVVASFVAALATAFVLLALPQGFCNAQDTTGRIPQYNMQNQTTTQTTDQYVRQDTTVRYNTPYTTLPPTRFGVRAGVNFSNLDTREVANSSITGFNVGIFAKLPLSRVIAIQPELYYSAKGAGVTYDNAIARGTAQFALNYLELPILLVINPIDIFNIHIGPYASYLLNGVVTNGTNNGFNFAENVSADDFNRFDAGLIGGIGVDLGTLSIGARYNLGLLRVGQERTFPGGTFAFPDARNGVISVYVSFSLL
jgi:GTPase SAR1 family protein